MVAGREAAGCLLWLPLLLFERFLWICSVPALFCLREPISAGTGTGVPQCPGLAAPQTRHIAAASVDAGHDATSQPLAWDASFAYKLGKLLISVRSSHAISLSRFLSIRGEMAIWAPRWHHGSSLTALMPEGLVSHQSDLANILQKKPSEGKRKRKTVLPQNNPLLIHLIHFPAWCKLS